MILFRSMANHALTLWHCLPFVLALLIVLHGKTRKRIRAHLALLPPAVRKCFSAIVRASRRRYRRRRSGTPPPTTVKHKSYVAPPVAVGLKQSIDLAEAEKLLPSTSPPGQRQFMKNVICALNNCLVRRGTGSSRCSVRCGTESTAVVRWSIALTSAHFCGGLLSWPCLVVGWILSKGMLLTVVDASRVKRPYTFYAWGWVRPVAQDWGRNCIWFYKFKTKQKIISGPNQNWGHCPRMHPTWLWSCGGLAQARGVAHVCRFDMLWRQGSSGIKCVTPIRALFSD